MQDKLKNAILWFSLPLFLIKSGAATILVILNIWLGMGLAGILQGTMDFDYNETFVVTLAGSLILLMIPGMQKGYAESQGKTNDIEKFKVRVAFAIGVGLYLFASLYALYGAYNVIEANAGKYTYMSFDWFGLIKPYEITKTLNYASLSFTLGKVMFAGGVDYIAGSLIEKDTAKWFNDEKTSANQAVNDKKDMELKRKFDEIYNPLEYTDINNETDFNNIQGKVGNLQSYPNQFFNEGFKQEALNKIKTLKEKLKTYRDANPK
jgi:hypothetical protein